MRASFGRAECGVIVAVVTKKQLVQPSFHEGKFFLPHYYSLVTQAPFIRLEKSRQLLYWCSLNYPLSSVASPLELDFGFKIMKHDIVALYRIQIAIRGYSHFSQLNLRWNNTGIIRSSLV